MIPSHHSTKQTDFERDLESASVVSPSKSEFKDVPLDDPPPSYQRFRSTRQIPILTPSMTASSKDSMELAQLPPLRYDEMAPESTAPYRPLGTASPVYGKNREMRKRLFLIIVAVVALLVICGMAAAIGIAVRKNNISVNVQPIFNVNGGTAADQGSKTTIPGPTVTATTTLTAPTPTVTKYVTISTTFGPATGQGTAVKSNSATRPFETACPITQRDVATTSTIGTEATTINFTSSPEAASVITVTGPTRTVTLTSVTTPATTTVTSTFTQVFQITRVTKLLPTPSISRVRSTLYVTVR